MVEGDSGDSDSDLSAYALNRYTKREQMHITAGMATIPEREAEAERAVASIIDQVDRVVIAFNGYDALPRWLRNYPWYTKIKALLTENEKWGDAGKFLGLEHADGPYLSIDDDLIYPPGYVRYMQQWSRALPDSPPVSLHGTWFDRRPVHYFDDRRAVGVLSTVDRVCRVTFPGTGCLYLPDHEMLRIEDFEMPGMADVWAGSALSRRGHYVYALPHPAGWVDYQDIPVQDTLWWKHKNDCEKQTEVAQEVWDITTRRVL